jgi:antitoxin VapB
VFCGKAHPIETNAFPLFHPRCRFTDDSVTAIISNFVLTLGKYDIDWYIFYREGVVFMESTAKLFKNGRSQAVRLPKDFRFKGTEVKIRKEGEKVILEPIEKSQWPDGFWDTFNPDPGFEIPEPTPPKEFSLD